MCRADDESEESDDELELYNQVTVQSSGSSIIQTEDANTSYSMQCVNIESAKASAPIKVGRAKKSKGNSQLLC